MLANSLDFRRSSADAPDLNSPQLPSNTQHPCPMGTRTQRTRTQGSWRKAQKPTYNVPCPRNLPVKLHGSPLYLKPGRPGDTSFPSLSQPPPVYFGATHRTEFRLSVNRPQTGTRSTAPGVPSRAAQIRPFRAICSGRTVPAAFSTTPKSRPRTQRYT